MFQITILFLYVTTGIAFAMSRWPGFASKSQLLVFYGFCSGALGLAWHTFELWHAILQPGGLSLSLGNAASFIGLQLALIAFIGAFEATLRGLSGGLLLLAAVTASMTGWATTADAVSPVSWHVQIHVMISLFAYGLLTVGAIVAVYALLQDRRLRSARLSPVNQLFAPLETTERLLFGIAGGGFTILLLAVFSGLAFVDNIFAQHLVHKTVLSLIALLLFGILLAGRRFAGWRGRSAVYLYLWGFMALGLAYFGSRYVLENMLGRTWG